jgi:hypothetical protein
VGTRRLDAPRIRLRVPLFRRPPAHVWSPPGSTRGRFGPDAAALFLWWSIPLRRFINSGRQVSVEENGLLTAPYSEDEVKKAIFQMEHNKTPGDEGLTRQMS